MNERLLAAACAVIAVLLAWAAVREAAGEASLAPAAARWRRIVGELTQEGRIDQAFGGRRIFAATVAAGAVAGWSLIGIPGVVAGALSGPLALRSLVRGRRRRYAAQIDACAPELAQALASALAAGRSVRGALLTAGVGTPAPLAAELDRAAVDLTLGGSVTDALAALRSRTGSARIESMAGAIELHRGSGGDLVRLMRELSEAFRARDRATRDALAASAQARYTAYVVAAIPVAVFCVLELVRPGAVSGAFALVATALMLLVAFALIAGGVLLARRISVVGR